jgi:acetamidase/formamidase
MGRIHHVDGWRQEKPARLVRRDPRAPSGRRARRSRRVPHARRDVAGHAPGSEAPIHGVLGGEPDDVESDYVVRLVLDRARGVWRLGEHAEIPLAPFMGILGVAPPAAGRTSTVHPGPYGGNLDCKELQVGATVLLPVFVPGALFSVGDGHGAQGDGEVDGAAVETGVERLVLEFGVVKRAGLTRPRAETGSHPIFLAFAEDLDAAVLEATRDVMRYLTGHRGLTRHEAYCLASVAVDFRITQVVDGFKGVHAMLPKSIFPRRPG